MLGHWPVFGFLAFKQNFNGYIVRKMGTFRYYPQPLKYKLIQGLITHNISLQSAFHGMILN